jgi:hypothetical protein
MLEKESNTPDDDIVILPKNLMMLRVPTARGKNLLCFCGEELATWELGCLMVKEGNIPKEMDRKCVCGRRFTLFVEKDERR